MFRIITRIQQKFSQSYPVLNRQFSKKLQSDPVLIRPKLASVLHQSDPVLSVVISDNHVKQCFTSKKSVWHTTTDSKAFQTTFLWKKQNSRHQTLLPFCPESEYFHQNRNFDLQHSAKLIDVTHVSAFDFMRKQKFFALMTSNTSSIWTTFRYERVRVAKNKLLNALLHSSNLTMPVVPNCWRSVGLHISCCYHNFFHNSMLLECGNKFAVEPWLLLAACWNFLSTITLLASFTFFC